MFAPLMNWETFKDIVEQIRDYAIAYENSYNEIQSAVDRQEGIKQILKALPNSAVIQVKKEKERLTEARRIDVSEKGAYVPV